VTRVAGFECTFEELDAIGDALRLDVRPFPFQFPVHGELVSDRIALFRAAHDTLAAKGLIEGEHFSSSVSDLLPAFSRGTVAIAVVGSSDGHGLCARAVTDGRLGVLAVESGGGVRFSSVRPSSMVRAVVRLLPVVRAGSGVAVTVSSASAGSDDLSAQRYMHAVRPAPSSREIVDRIMRRPRSGSGYMTVTVRSKSPLTLSWIDTDVGRYLALPSTDRDGRVKVTYAPADRGVLEQNLTRLVTRLT
jgi:hypothetical protein